MKIRTLIVDDEAPARGRIRQLLKAEGDVELIGECANGREALERIRHEKPDLLFLDIQMPRLTGLDVCSQLEAEGVQMPFIVFCTAYDQYALKAFEVHAIDYLLKPLDPERFRRALDHARSRLCRTAEAPAAQRLADLLEDLRASARQNGRFVFKQDGRVVFIRAEAIDWVEADGNYVRIHCGNDSHYVRETLAHLETQLIEDKFMRISRSVIVNLDRIKECRPLFYGDYSVVLHSGATLTLSRNYKERLQRLLESRR